MLLEKITDSVSSFFRITLAKIRTFSAPMSNFTTFQVPTNEKSNSTDFSELFRTSGNPENYQKPLAVMIVFTPLKTALCIKQNYQQVNKDRSEWVHSYWFCRIHLVQQEDCGKSLRRMCQKIGVLEHSHLSANNIN